MSNLFTFHPKTFSSVCVGALKALKKVREDKDTPPSSCLDVTHGCVVWLLDMSIERERKTFYFLRKTLTNKSWQECDKKAMIKAQNIQLALADTWCNSKEPFPPSLEDEKWCAALRNFTFQHICSAVSLAISFFLLSLGTKSTLEFRASIQYTIYI